MLTMKDIEEYARREGDEHPKLAAARMRILQLEQTIRDLELEAADREKENEDLRHENTDQSDLIRELQDEVEEKERALAATFRLVAEALVGPDGYAEAVKIALENETPPVDVADDTDYGPPVTAMETACHDAFRGVPSFDGLDFDRDDG